MQDSRSSADESCSTKACDRSAEIDVACPDSTLKQSTMVTAMVMVMVKVMVKLHEPAPAEGLAKKPLEAERGERW